MPQLVAFQPEPWLNGITLQCTADWNAGRLDLHYRLAGALHTMLLPALAERPQRCDGLWQSSCFEAFFGQPQDPGYWELNIAPSGDWNLYRLSGYRRDLTPELRVSALAPTWKRTAEQLELDLSLDLAKLIAPSSSLELSITAVLEQREHGCSYWAVHHSGPEPDFHRRDSFSALSHPGA